jgi:hypothetical protein
MSNIHDRSERLAKLLSLRAPLSLITNEARMLIRGQEESDLEWGFGIKSRWPALAIWGMACLCNQQESQIRDLKRQVRELKKRKKSEGQQVQS